MDLTAIFDNDNVLCHSLIELASVGSIWSEMATQPRESHNVLEADLIGIGAAVAR